MLIEYWLGAAVTLGLLVYLVYALLRPERQLRPRHRDHADQRGETVRPTRGGGLPVLALVNLDASKVTTRPQPRPHYSSWAGVRASRH